MPSREPRSLRLGKKRNLHFPKKLAGSRPAKMAACKASPIQLRRKTMSNEIEDEDDGGKKKLVLKEKENPVLGLDSQFFDAVESQKAAGPFERDSRVEVNVIARLVDPKQEVPGLNVVRIIGTTVTGTVMTDKIESVRDHSNVIVLSAARGLRPELAKSVPEVGATTGQLQTALPQALPTVTGAGIVVGIVDYGCDFVHNNFRTPGGTRLLYLWDQNGKKNPPDGFGYGQEFDDVAINRALNAANPYESLGYEPGEGSHGTHVMDIAAGNGRATGNPGVAPEADLIFVHVSTGDVGREQTFGDSRHLLEAVDYIFTKAQALDKPAVINLSLGTHGGPHDGSTLVEQTFDEILITPGRAIVLSAGNSWKRKSHAFDTIEAGGRRTLRWEIDRNDESTNELEIWYNRDHKLALTLITIDDQKLGPVHLNDTQVIEVGNGEEWGRIIHQPSNIGNGDNQIDILLDGRLYGDWRVELKNVGTERAAFHAWIERDDRGQSRFAENDVKRSFTLGSISCGKQTIAVGSYNAAVSGRPLSDFTAEGPTRDGRKKPEVSAPGHRINAANSMTQGTTTKSGTSMAAPHVTGIIALLMQAAGRKLTIAEVHQAVIGTARKNPPSNNSGVDARYGNGRVDCTAALQII
jgi:subtilisin family serine protease